MRKLVGCDVDDMIAGLVMVGISKTKPKELRKRRIFDEVFKDL
jgi:hypothetical protein